MLYPDVDINGHPLIKPLAELLSSDPELLHSPKTATDWAALLKSDVSPGSKLRGEFTRRFVKLHLKDCEDQFVHHFGMTTIAYRGKTWYMFSQAGPTGGSEGTRLLSPPSANVPLAAEAA
jgi:hypothetical protein